MTPYNYVANNPINFIDPDGRDFRMIIQRDKRGNIVNIAMHATVYLQGNGASQDLADKLNKGFSDRVKSRNIAGVGISINATYVYDKGKVKNQDNLNAGQNILNVRNDMKDVSHVIGSQVDGIPKIANFCYINTKDGSVDAGIHETLHLFGFSDRYDDFTGQNSGWNKVTHSPFTNDLMGNSSGGEFKDVHFENILNFANENSSQQGTNTNGFQYIDNNKNYIDRKNKSTLRNGSQANTYYHEHSKQSQ